MKEEQPELYKKTYKFISIKEYGIYKLYKHYVIDDSIASATGIFNLKTLKWDVDVLGILNIST
ncbi:carbohydrate kinase [Bacillus anthracis]|nr:carbohydrate kinase [Bacillus anthracis]